MPEGFSQPQSELLSQDNFEAYKKLLLTSPRREETLETRLWMLGHVATRHGYTLESREELLRKYPVQTSATAPA